MGDRMRAGGRIVPTKPGWWWVDMSKWHGSDAPPEPLEAYIEDGRSTFDGMDDGDPSEDQVTWLAPIPGPEVCAALARYSEAVAAYEADSLRDASRELTDAEWSESEAIERAVSDATAILDAAIRAERGAA